MEEFINKIGIPFLTLVDGSVIWMKVCQNKQMAQTVESLFAWYVACTFILRRRLHDSVFNTKRTFGHRFGLPFTCKR